LAKERLGLFYYKSSRRSAAAKALTEAYKAKKKCNAPPKEIAVTLEHLAKNLHAEEKYQEALTYYAQALKIHNEHKSECDVQRTLNNIGQTLAALGLVDQAQDLYNKLYVLLQEYHSQKSDVAVALENRAKLYAENPGTYKEAEQAYRQALEIKIKTLGELHADTAITKDHLAQLLVKCERYAEAEQLYRSAIFTLRQKFQPTHFAIGASLHNIATLHTKTGNWYLALETEEEAVTVFNIALGPDHQLSMSARNSLNDLLRRFRRPLGEEDDDTMMPSIVVTAGDDDDSPSRKPSKEKSRNAKSDTEAELKSSSGVAEQSPTVLKKCNSSETLHKNSKRIRESDGLSRGAHGKKNLLSVSTGLEGALPLSTASQADVAAEVLGLTEKFFSAFEISH